MLHHPDNRKPDEAPSIAPSEDPSGAVYLDHAATTPLAPEVCAAVVHALAHVQGNPANSSHRSGRDAAAAIESARAEVAQLVGAPSDRIFLTSGATEANNLAIRGTARVIADDTRRTIVVSAIEHRSVLCPVDELALYRGITVRRAAVTGDGVIDLDALDQLLDGGVLLVCVHLANNEIGTLQPIKAVVERAHAHGALVLCDATQAIGKVPVDVDALGVDMLSLSAHKFHGPKGSGAIYVAPHVSLTPQVTGGGQECGLRAGTPNVPAIIGTGVAARGARHALQTGEPARIEALRDRLEQELARMDPSVQVNGGGAPRLPGISSLTFPGRRGDELVRALPELELSRGSACSTASPVPSHVLRALGHSEEAAFATLRISLGATSTTRDVDVACAAFARALAPR